MDFVSGVNYVTDITSDRCSVSGECIVLTDVCIHPSGICEHIR